MAASPELATGDCISVGSEPVAEPLSSVAAESEEGVNAAIEPVEEENAAAAASASDEAPTEKSLNEAAAAESVTQAQVGGAEVRKWPGWPGDNVYRLIVPLLKVGSIIGRKGEAVKKLCEETKSRVRILEAPIGVSDRIVLISGKEELDAEISPAMDALLRIFKRINGISDIVAHGMNLESTAPGSGTCSVRLLVASSQAVSLIGKKGESIKSIQENSNATVRVLTGDLPVYAAPDERMVEIQGESLKVLKALEAVIEHLRKFLVDHSVLPLFEKSYNAPATQDRLGNNAWGENSQSLGHNAQQSMISSDYALPMKRDSSHLDRESYLESQISHSGLALYGQDPSVSGLRSSTLGRSSSALEITQKMEIPLSYAEDIIGIGGVNIAYMRRASGAAITIEESRESPDEIIVEIRGTSSQVHAAQLLVQEFIAGRRDPVSSSYRGIDAGLRSSYSHMANTAYSSSSLASQSYGGYGGYGGYGI